MEIDWEKYGFKEAKNHGDGVFSREDFPFVLEVVDDHLHVMFYDEGESITYTISLRTIPATNQAVVLLLKAFNCPKLAE